MKATLTNLLFLALVLLCGGQMAMAASIYTMPGAPGFTTREAQVIGGVTYWVGFVNDGGAKPAYVTSLNPTVAVQIPLPQIGSETAVTARILGIDAQGNFAINANFLSQSQTRVFTGNVSSPQTLTMIPSGSGSAGNYFASGIVEGVVYGINAQFDPATAKLGESSTVVQSGPGGGNLSDGRSVAGQNYYVGSTTYGSTSAAVWKGDDLFNLISCGGSFCSFTDMDPSGQFAIGDIDGVIMWAGISDTSLTLPMWNGDYLYGWGAGIIAGASGPTLFYQNSDDLFNVWVFNELLGVNLRFNEFCTANPLVCTAAGSDLRSLGRMNFVDGDPNRLVFGGTGSTWFGALANPDPVPYTPGSNAEVPEPGTFGLLGLGLLAAEVRRRRLKA
jgi:hypothetical protein